MKRIVLTTALVIWCTVLFADSIPDASRHIGQELILFCQNNSKFNSIYPQEKYKRSRYDHIRHSLYLESELVNGTGGQ